MRDIMRQLCEWEKIEVLEGNTQVDHIYLVLPVPPKYSISEAVGLIKGMNVFEIIGTVGRDEKIPPARQTGADLVVNYRRQRFSEIVNEATNSRGVDLILDLMGGNTSQESLECLATFGRIVNFNSSGDEDGTVNTRLLHASCRSVPGFSLYTTLRYRPERIQKTAACVLPMLEKKQIYLFVWGAYPLGSTGKAHELIENRNIAEKLLLKP